ncbi:hypothetical protein [Bradyrhizobium sp. HKCCYLS20291]|uniref:hypothetical protein n=1 Tax=Bradyrhizobium sp. HKCCYLS20291 TaxID=3420766 RepID=UPI003EB7462B
MPRRPAKVTQADIARAIRAAKEAGANEVNIAADGTIRISLAPGPAPIGPVNDCVETWAPSEALQRYLNGSESG